jgi:uncharacterized protein
MLTLRQSGTDVILPVAVQPRASRNAMAGLYGNALKLLLTAPAVEGAANAACLRLLANLLGISRARLSIVRGAKTRQKLIRITNISVDALHAQLRNLLPDVDL